MFWGVRDIKKVQFMNCNRPQAELDCCYGVTKQTGEEENVVKSVVVKNARRNPNFDDSVDIFDVVSFELVYYDWFWQKLLTGKPLAKTNFR